MKHITSRHVVITSFVVDLSDVFLNLFIAILSGSVVMFSQALQGGADLLTSGLLLVGVNRSRRRANRLYRFGQGREIYFWTLMAGISMFLVTSVSSLFLGVQRFLYPETIDYIPLSLAILFIGLLTNGYAFFLSVRRLHGTHPKQPIWKTFIYSDLIEVKAAFILDLMGTISAILGLLALGIYVMTGDSRYDGVGAMLIGIVTAVLSTMLMLEVKDLLVGKSAPEEIENKIRETTLKIHGVEDVLDLRTMYLGSERLLVNMEVHVTSDKTTVDIEQLIDKIKAHVKKTVPSTRHIQVELETP